jgi:hypothetical protein
VGGKSSKLHLRYNYKKCIAKEIAMPISLRLPADVETQIAGFGARQGLTKSAVIVRSIQEYLAKHAQPSSFEIYEDVMQGAAKLAGNTVQQDALREAAELRPLKQQARDAIRRKHAERSKRATQASATTSSRTNRKAA